MTYSDWHHSGNPGALLLYECYTALAAGAEPDEDNNYAFLVFVPKASPENTGPVLSAVASGYRPITSSNTPQKVIPRAMCQTLELCVAEVVFFCSGVSPLGVRCWTRPLTSRPI